MSHASESISAPLAESEPRSRSRRGRLAWAAVILVLLLLVVWLGVGTYAAMVMNKGEVVFIPEKNPAAYGMTYEDVRFPATDGEAEIAAWYIPSTDNERAVVLVHGRNASRTNAILERFPEVAAGLNEAGFSVLMIDLRGHGESSASPFSFGINERYDVLGAVDWLKGRGYESGKIGVLGISLGAVSSVGAAAEEPAIGALVTDSGFAEFQPLIEEGWTEESGLPKVFMYSMLLMTRLLYGFDLFDSRPVDEIGAMAPRPVMMIHCQTDETVPYSHMEQMAAAAQSAETWTIPICDHAEGYVVVEDEYDRRVSAFFDQNLK